MIQYRMAVFHCTFFAITGTGYRTTSSFILAPSCRMFHLPLHHLPQLIVLLQPFKPRSRRGNKETDVENNTLQMHRTVP